MTAIFNVFENWNFTIVMVLFWGVTFYQYYKKTLKKSKDFGTATILIQITTSVFAVLFIPFFKMQFPSELSLWSLLILACIFYAISDRLQTIAKKFLPISTNSIINQLSTVLVIIISLLFLDETVSINKIIGILFVIGANLMVLYEPNQKFILK